MGQATLVQAAQFLRGAWDFRRHPSTLADLRVAITEGVAHRSARFLDMLDAVVWPFPASPTRRLLDTAGLEAGDVRALVTTDGLDAALSRLVDAGVYVAYDEWLGKVPIQRGSVTFDAGPAAFANPLVRPDFLITSGGSRSGGTTVGGNFATLRLTADEYAVGLAMWGFESGPTCVWFPPLPSSAGLQGALVRLASGQPAERWFSPTPLFLRGEAASKRGANAGLWALGMVPGTGFPRLRALHDGDVTPVLDWAAGALRRHGRAHLGGYTTGAVRLATAAVERGVALDGLLLMVTGEPVSGERVAAINAAGATAMGLYGCTPFGILGVSCPECAEPSEETHVWSHHFGVVTRPRIRPDGVAVDALCITTIDAGSQVVCLNVENDDYADVSLDTQPCGCVGGQLGLRHRIARVRGVSKVVVGGTTVPGDALQAIVDRDLPAALGGAPGDYQFTEQSKGGLVLRIHPRVADVDGAAAIALVQARLDQTSPGRLATSVWQADGGIRVVREPPCATRGGKVLAFEPLQTA